MPNYKAPIRDIKFVINEMMGYEAHYQALYPNDEVTPDLVDAILEEGAKFCEGEIAPLYRIGDEEGCSWNDGVVTTPSGFKEAYKAYCEAGWPSLTGEAEYGGQGLPDSLGGMLEEMTGTANHAWGMYASLSEGCKQTIVAHGTDEQKQQYLPKLVDGSWTGTMCLTESHAGTDLGMLRTKAEPNADGSYSISGTKIFISAGDHDMSDNVVHIVLAKLPDAPAGTKGISLFIVPKFNVDANGEIIDRNEVHCGSIEHKMGIHGNATCVLNFDGAKGYLIGQPNKGLRAMFTFMNQARLGTAHEGMCHAEFGFQESLAYALDRLQGRSMTGPKNANGAADPIIVHPDVRRMLLTQKAISEGGRMFIYYCYKLVDVTQKSDDEAARQAADDMLSYMTPIAKAFLTELGFESANLAVQCFGGHGYISEWGVEQNLRDSRIAMLYEGTTGIQGLDLIGRKVLGSGGKLFDDFSAMVDSLCQQHEGNENMQEFVAPLQQLNSRLRELTEVIKANSADAPDELGAAAVDYLMSSGYLVLGYFWAMAADKAQQTLAAGTTEEGFYRGKLETARFYFQRLLPRTLTHAAAIESGAANLMTLDAEHFAR